MIRHRVSLVVSSWNESTLNFVGDFYTRAPSSTMDEVTQTPQIPGTRNIKIYAIHNITRHSSI